MNNREKIQLAYDYMFNNIPMSKQGDNLTDPYSCSPDGLFGKYGGDYNISYQEIKKELNKLGIDTEGSWGGHDKGKYKKNIDKISYDDLMGFYKSGERNISIYVDNILADPDYYKGKQSRKPSSSRQSYQTQQNDYDGYETGDFEASESGNTRGTAKLALNLIGAIILIVIVLKVFGAIGGFLGNTVSGITDFVSSDYKVETFEYKGRHFIGDKKYNKPNGVCYSYDSSYSDGWVLGEYSSGKFGGYGVVTGSSSGSSYVDIGNFNNKYNLKGYGIHISSGAAYVGKFSSGKPSGYGYMVDSTGEHIIKFKSIKGADYSESVKIIATKSGSKWLKPNGKELKVSNNKYKGIEFTGTKEVVIGDITFDLSTSSGKYSVAGLELKGSNNGATYNTRIGSNSAGIDMSCTSSGDVSGTYAYEVSNGLAVNNFSTK